jgi:hypothetical protein
MQFVFSDLSTVSSKDQPEDEIDRLFEKLHLHEPPLNIARQILACIQQLPGGQQYPSSSAQTQTPPVRPGQAGSRILH